MGIRNKLKQKDEGLPILQRYEILDKIRQLDRKRDKALVALLYLTACRISEVGHYVIEKNLKRTRRDKKTDKDIPDPIKERQQKGLPIMKKQIEFDGDIMRIYNVRSLKKKRYSPRTIPIIISKEQKFVDIIKDYLSILDEDELLFDVTRQRAYQILSEVGLFPHYLRHLRLTHLTIDYGFSAAELKKFVNWTSSQTADNYVHLNVEDLIDKMRK